MFAKLDRKNNGNYIDQNPLLNEKCISKNNNRVNHTFTSSWQFQGIVADCQTQIIIRIAQSM